MPKKRPPGLRSYDRKKRIAVFDIWGAGSRRRYRKKVTAASYDDAIQQLEAFRRRVKGLEREAEPDAGLAVTVEGPLVRSEPALSPTFNEYLASVRDRLKGRWAASTTRNNDYALDAYIRPFLGTVPIANIDEPTLDDFVEFLQTPQPTRRALSAPTVNFCLRLVRQVLVHAFKRDMIRTEPSIPKKEEKQLTLELTVTEHRAFLDAFTDFEAYAQYVRRSSRTSVHDEQVRVYFSWFRQSRPLFVVALETGLRKADLLNLRWRDVDFDKLTISLIQQKTGDRVFIPISEACDQALRELRRRSVSSSQWVFTRQDGGRYSETVMRKHFKAAKVIAGIDRRLRIHDLRHSFGSALASEGVSLQVISAVMGHSSLEMTRRYARPDKDAMKAVARALDSRLSKREAGDSVEGTESGS